MKISTIIITKNEEKNIIDCLESVGFSDQIIVIDNDSADRTVELAKKHGAQVESKKFSDFSTQREEGLKRVTNDWVFYLDADERVTPQLKDEIEKVIEGGSEKRAFKIKRRNFYFKSYEWNQKEEMVRLFKKQALEGWSGSIHESPIFSGEVGSLEGYLDHYTHSDLSSMLNKTIKWSDAEARIRLEVSHPKMSWWRFPRVMIPVFFKYYVGQRGYKLGVAGLVESIFQTYSIFITYAKLWEMQKKSI